MNTSTIFLARGLTACLFRGKRSNHGPYARVTRSPRLPCFTFFAEIEFSVGTGELIGIVFKNRDIRAVVESLRLKRGGSAATTQLLHGEARQNENFRLLHQLQFGEQFKVPRAERVLCEATTSVALSGKVTGAILRLGLRGANQNGHDSPAIRPFYCGCHYLSFFSL